MRAIILLLSLFIMMSSKAYAELSVRDSRTAKTIDFITLNELNQAAEDVWSRRNLNEMIEFKNTINQYLESGAVSLADFSRAVDGNWFHEAYRSEEKYVTGGLHPYLVHTFFDIIIPNIRAFEKRSAKKSSRSYETHLRFLEIKIFEDQDLPDIQVINFGINIAEFKSDLIWTKKAAFVYFLLVAMQAKPCSADLTTIDYLSATWSLQSYLDKLLPNRITAGSLVADECAVNAFNELKSSYGNTMNSHADAVFGNLKLLLERK